VFFRVCSWLAVNDFSSNPSKSCVKLAFEAKTMQKLFVILLVAVSLFVSPGFESKAIGGQNRLPSPKRTPPVSAEIEKIEVDKKEIFIPLPPQLEKYFDGPLASVRMILGD
jgi:hypothetical protein